jgi:hypothetical protein
MRLLTVGRMGIRCFPTTVTLWLCALGPLFSACQRDERPSTVRSAKTVQEIVPCPVGTGSSGDWVTVQDTEVHVTFRLPRGSRRNDHGRVWTTPFGTVSFVMNEGDSHWLDSLFADSSSSAGDWCRDSRGQEPATVQTYYGTQTFGKGQYVLAVWAPTTDTHKWEVELVGFGRDSTDLAALLEVIESVQFVPARH